MTTRREFIKLSALGSGLLASSPILADTATATSPIVISTWNFGLKANDAAWKILSGGGRALDAVEAGARVPEADPEETSVGLGGLP
ncbi:MAG: twin-arginine translocation signal domain-containing protein, partial [Chryseosolibacter sp.]